MQKVKKYNDMTKAEVIKSLRQLSVDMNETGLALHLLYPNKNHGIDMQGAATIANEWADEMEKEL